MNIAELFVTLGIKGEDKTQKALTGVKGTLGEISTGALAAKAAVIAAVYALERLVSASGNRGNDLRLFAEATGLSAEKLQRYQYAAEMAGASSGELKQAIKQVQDQFTGMRLGEGAVKSIEAISRYTGGIDKNRLKDTWYMFGKIQEAAQKMPADIGRHLLAPLVGENVFAAMRTNAFNPAALASANVNSDSTNKRLQSVKTMWSKMEWEFDRMSDRVIGRFGPEFMKEITKLIPVLEKLVPIVIKLGEAFGNFMEKIHGLEIIDEILKGWAIIFDGISSAIDKVADYAGIGKDKKGNLKKNPVALASDWISGKINDYYDYKDMEKGLNISRQIPGVNSKGGVTVNVNQNITHHGNAHDTKAVGDTHRAATQKAWQANKSAQGQVN